MTIRRETRLMRWRSRHMGALGRTQQRFLRRWAQRVAAVSRGKILEDRFATGEETGLSGRGRKV
jgi:hypothetical protein